MDLIKFQMWVYFLDMRDNFKIFLVIFIFFTPLNIGVASEQKLNVLIFIKKHFNDFE